MENFELELKLTVAHVNTILKHLGAGAYAEVSELIGLLHGQSQPQLQAAAQAAPVADPAPVAPAEEQTIQ